MARLYKPFVIILPLLFLSSVLAGQNAHRIRVSEAVSQAMVTKTVPPKYPQQARSEGIQGAVVMKADISTEGDVAELIVVSGHPLLAPAALEAAKQWKYRPYVLNGEAVVVETQITLNFKLSH
jgi:protein TonB